MSKYVCYYSAKKIFYREFATRWAKWAKTANLSNIEIIGISLFFTQVAKRFGLICEFRELGVI